MFQKIPVNQAQIKLYFIKREKLILMNSLKLSMRRYSITISRNIKYYKLNLIMFFSNLRMYMLLHESNEPNHLVNYSSLSKPISIGSGENNASRTMQNGALFKSPFNYSCMYYMQYLQVCGIINGLSCILCIYHSSISLHAYFLIWKKK